MPGLVFIQHLTQRHQRRRSVTRSGRESAGKPAREVHDLKLAARFTTRTPANWKNIVDNYLECYHCGPAHPGFSDSVQVDRYWALMHGNWTLQYGFAKPSEQSFKFEEGTDAAFHGFWLWPCTMLNVTPIKGMMTVIYEFPVDSKLPCKTTIFTSPMKS